MLARLLAWLAVHPRSLPTLLASTVALVPMASSAAPAGPEIGDAAPAFRMKTINPALSGRKILSVRRHVGAKPEEPMRALVLTFSASYCEPCKKELAALAPLAARFAKARVLVAAVIVDREAEGIAAMRKLTVDDLKLGFPVVSDRFGIVSRRYRADTLPKVVIIGADGRVTWVKAGYADGSVQALLDQLGLSS